MEFIFVVMVRSFVNWAVRKQWGSRHSCRVRRSPGRGVVGLEDKRRGREERREGRDEGRWREDGGGGWNGEWSEERRKEGKWRKRMKGEGGRSRGGRGREGRWEGRKEDRMKKRARKGGK